MIYASVVEQLSAFRNIRAKHWIDILAITIVQLGKAHNTIK